MKKILLIEDDEELRLVVEMFLSWAQFEVVMACDGVEGLEFLSKTHFDLVITDFRMPRMNGIEFSKKAKELYPELPIIMSSGFIPDLDHELKEKLHFVSKPYQVNEMIFKINDLLEIQTRIDLAL
jgi:CheY-like chemotaxis protein